MIKLTISHVNQLTQPKNNDENPNSWLGIFEKMLDKKRSVLIVVQLLRVYHVCVCVCVQVDIEFNAVYNQNDCEFPNTSSKQTQFKTARKIYGRLISGSTYARCDHHVKLARFC